MLEVTTFRLVESRIFLLCGRCLVQPTGLLPTVSGVVVVGCSPAYL